MMRSSSSSTKPVDPAPEPIVGEVCAKTCGLISGSDGFTKACADAVCDLLNTSREKMKPAQILEALSDPSEADVAEEVHEDS